MNIHREMAVYRLYILRTNEAMQRMKDTQSEAQQRGDDLTDSWEFNAETQIFNELDRLATEKRNEICDAFEDRENPLNVKDRPGRLSDDRQAQSPMDPPSAESPCLSAPGQEGMP